MSWFIYKPKWNYFASWNNKKKTQSVKSLLAGFIIYSGLNIIQS